MFERSANPMVLLDEQRRILEANGPTLALLGFPRGSLIGRPLGEIIAPQERARASAAWSTFARTRKNSPSAAARLNHSDA